MIFSLDQKSRLPIYEQLYQSVTRMAALGVLEAEAQLPSVRTLAQELGVNPNTVQKAYHMLEHDGIIVSVPGKGSFLAKGDPAVLLRRKQILSALRSTIAEAAECGIEKSELYEITEACYQERRQSE